MSEPKHPVRTVDRTFEILEIIQKCDGAGISEIADRVDIGKSAVHNHLSTLMNREYVEKDGDNYHIGLSFLSLGAYARNRMSIYDTAKSQVDELAAETGELVNLLVEKNGVGVYLYQSKGDSAVELDTHEGKHVQLHCTALGKAILGFRSQNEVDTILREHGLPQVTADTITNREEFLATLEKIREQRYAIDNEERLKGLRCIAAPITNDADRSIAAISISSPIHRIDDEYFYNNLAEAVLGAANVIELKYNYS